MKNRIEIRIKIKSRVAILLGVMTLACMCNSTPLKAHSKPEHAVGDVTVNSAHANGPMLFSTFLDKDKLDEKSKKEAPKFEQAYALQKAKDVSGALTLYKAIVQECPERFEAFYNMGVCQEHLGQLKDALHSFENVARLNRLYKPVYLNLAAIHEKLGETEKAKSARAVWNQL